METPSHPLNSPNNVQNTSKTNKWNTAKDLTLVSYPSKQRNYDEHTEYAQKLKEVRHILSNVGEDPLEGLKMIDAIQRLGIDYHFQEEIEAILQRQYTESETHEHNGNDLYEVSLRFRLLRQQGYCVPADVFNNFKGKEGKFKERVSKDIMGLMSLYEASQLSIDGEDVLDEAANYSSRLLNAWLALLDNRQAIIVENTLKHPYHKSLARFTAKNFHKDFRSANGWENVLQELAELDFNRVQSIHQKEILQISKWWKDLGLAKELKFARNQPLKWYMWTVAALTDPSLSEQRIELTKPISLVYVIDDIFDVYGTLEDVTIFTEAVSRWEYAAVDQLPDYMKICFKALYDITNEIGYKVYKKNGWNPVECLRKMWASLCDAFLVERKWFASGHLPRAEEYLKNGSVSSGVPVVLVHLFFLLGNGITKESANLVNDMPGIISSVATILRLWDDLGSAKDENQDGHDGSYVECYKEEHQIPSVEIAQKYVISMISDTWKRLNKECLSPNPFPASFIKASLNVARMVPVMYNYDANHHLPALKEHIKSMIHDSVSLQL